jgi:hypothetical protein
MTTTAIDRPEAFSPLPVGGPHSATQATQIEQARAIAEVQAAVVVAQQCPRDLQRAEAEMRDACSRTALANRAFYRVPNRGQGPSVHLARELARIWGNVQYGVHELRRDDRAGMSEIQAFAWDVQTNTRSTRTFQVPHQRMVTNKATGEQTRKDLIDLGDVYLNNQNVGARAVRECIFTVLPAWYTEAAEDLCRNTLRDGDGKPLPQRIEEVVSAYARTHGVKVEQLEAKLGRKRSTWDAGDVASLGVLWRSVERGEVTISEEFGQATPVVSLASFTTQQPEEPRGDATPEPEQPDVERITDAQRKAMFATFTAAGFDTDARSAEGRAARLNYIVNVIRRKVESTNDLTRAEAGKVIDALTEDAAERNGGEIQMGGA